ncbi:MAG TPA: hypothetical protein VFQ88_11055 [Nevskiaceae bacterium]|nr:hypothetical protein [Nevskiaceae bacterium]
MAAGSDAPIDGGRKVEVDLGDGKVAVFFLPSEREMATRSQMYVDKAWMDALLDNRAADATDKGLLLAVIGANRGGYDFACVADDRRISGNGLRPDGSIRYMSTRWMTRRLNRLCEAGYLEKRAGGTYGLTRTTAAACKYAMAAPSKEKH